MIGNAFEKTKTLQSGAKAHLSFDVQRGPKLEVYTDLKNITFMIFSNSYSGLSYAKRIFNGLQ